MKNTPRLLLPAAALVLLFPLAACGGSAGSGDAAATSASPSADPSTSPSSAGDVAGGPSADPTAGAPGAAPTCPITTTTVPADASISKNLKVKPVIPAHTAPAPTGITVADVVVGTGKPVVVGSEMKLKYVGALYVNGTEFDSSWKISDAQTLDLNGALPKACYEGVVAGFSVGPIGMKEGGRREITFPADYGYGSGGQGDIPPGAALVFVVDLVTVVG